MAILRFMDIRGEQKTTETEKSKNRKRVQKNRLTSLIFLKKFGCNTSFWNTLNGN